MFSKQIGPNCVSASFFFLLLHRYVGNGCHHFWAAHVATSLSWNKVLFCNPCDQLKLGFIAWILIICFTILISLSHKGACYMAGSIGPFQLYKSSQRACPFIVRAMLTLTTLLCLVKMTLGFLVVGLQVLWRCPCSAQITYSLSISIQAYFDAIITWLLLIVWLMCFYFIFYFFVDFLLLLLLLF